MQLLRHIIDGPPGSAGGFNTAQPPGDRVASGLHSVLVAHCCSEVPPCTSGRTPCLSECRLPVQFGAVLELAASLFASLAKKCGPIPSLRPCFHAMLEVHVRCTRGSDVIILVGFSV